jgi:hypothetical protein
MPQHFGTHTGFGDRTSISKVARRSPLGAELRARRRCHRSADAREALAASHREPLPSACRRHCLPLIRSNQLSYPRITRQLAYGSFQQLRSKRHEVVQGVAALQQIAESKQLPDRFPRKLALAGWQVGIEYAGSFRVKKPQTADE